MQVMIKEKAKGVQRNERSKMKGKMVFKQNKQDFAKSDKFHTFLQVIPVTVIHGANTTVVNALLDSGSDTTLITSELAKILKLKGKQRKLNIANAISTSVSITSNLVEFSICSSHHPDQIEVKNAWVVNSLNLP